MFVFVTTMSIRRYITFSNRLSKFSLNLQCFFRRTNSSAATATASFDEPVLLYQVIKNEDHFIISEEKSGRHLEVTFAWLRDHCRLA